MNLFQQAELGFDKLFGYNRQQSESFDYYNTVKNGSISEQLKLQQKEIQPSKKTENNQISNQENLLPNSLENKGISDLALRPLRKNNKESNEYALNHQFDNKESSLFWGSLIPCFLLETDVLSNSNIPKKQLPKSKKKKGRKL